MIYHWTLLSFNLYINCERVIFLVPTQNYRTLQYQTSILGSHEQILEISFAQIFNVNFSRVAENLKKEIADNEAKYSDLENLVKDKDKTIRRYVCL